MYYINIQDQPQIQSHSLCILFCCCIHFITFFSLFFREKPKREKRPSKYARNRWKRSRRRRRRWESSHVLVILTLFKLLKLFFHLCQFRGWTVICYPNVQWNVSCHCAVVFYSVLASLHYNDSIRLWFCQSLAVGEACVVCMIRHSAILEEWNILITARPIPVNVTLHTHSYCSTQLLYIGIAYNLILKPKWTKGWGNSCSQACSQTHRTQANTYIHLKTIIVCEEGA